MPGKQLKQAIQLQMSLQGSIGKKLQLKINDNRSIMLSVKWEPACTKVSLHRMFLEAPQNVMDELTCYLKREKRQLTPGVKAYIEHNLQKLDYSHELDLDKLQTKGKCHDLREIYDRINREYFEGRLQLHITWFGRPLKRNASRITFGLYYDPLKLIKINRILDHVRVPVYLVEYVIYHEMLHYVCPTFVDEKGQKHIHSKAFKKKEKEFAHYAMAQNWIKTHQSDLFN